MAELLDSTPVPLQIEKFYIYSGELCIIRSLDLIEDASSKEKYLGIEFSSGFRKIYSGAFSYLHPINDLDKTLKGLEKQVQFLKDNKANQSEQTELDLIEDKSKAQNKTHMNIKKYPYPIRETDFTKNSRLNH